MSNKVSLDKGSIKKNYFFLGLMISGMILGAITGWFAPEFGNAIKPLGTIFINMMFCVVVPLVFASISSSIANMKSRERAGKIMVSTIITFIVTGIIAAIIMFVIMQVFPPVLEPWQNMTSEEIGEYASLSDMIVNFFTASDFVGLLSRRAMLPLIVFSIIFGFATSMAGGPDSLVGQWIASLSDVMMKFIDIITKYAPIAFFAIFADLVATYGSAVTSAYGRAMAVYYPLCFIYLFTAFPLYAWYGGGKHGIKTMFKYIARPAIVSLGTCSSVATIPTNIEVSRETGIDDDISSIVIPLGATMHMDGSCFSCVLKIAFVLGALGQPFTWGMLPQVVAVAVLSSVGMSGVPGGGYIGEYIIASIFFPAQIEIAFPILVAIGNLVDPPATMINSAGDYVVTFIVSRFNEGKDWLDKAIAKQNLEVKA
ncbi:MAG: dicarboxylate/amino acid:cation symporter [Tissierellia bacterium]|nr:dicarboxylate/amino acid:cation symporter [Tissierellia bacterium]